MDKISHIRKPIEAELEQFGALFDETMSQADGLLGRICQGIAERKGKLMRPILVLLVAKCYGQVNDSIYHLASAVELLHQGSLIHDDVVDESDKRRGKQSANAVYDNKMAVLLGDYIVSMALRQITATSNVKSVDALSTLIGTLSEGEITQLNALDNTKLSEDLYFDIISKKTAILFSSCTSLSALLSGASDADIEAFRQFGHVAGLCFQIMDDILDYHDSSETGKPSGNDLKEGKFTLPAIYALTHSDRDWSAHIKAIRSLEATPEQIREVTEYSVSNGGIEYSLAKMEELKKQAIQGLPAFISSDLRHSFECYLDLITNRVK